MRAAIYHQGEPGRKYGMWDRQQKKFVFGICEDTPMLAVARLFQRLGNEARKYRMEPRELPAEQYE